MTDSVPLATGRISIDAAPSAVYDAIADLEVLAELADEAVSMRWTSGSRAAVGAVFTGSNRNGWRRWSTHCTVTDADAGTCFGFEVTYGPLRTPIAFWRYDLQLTARGCIVTESMWDRRPGWFLRVGALATGVSDRATVNTAHIETTLARLKTYAESSATRG